MTRIKIDKTTGMMGVILAVAFVARIWGINYGLPNWYHMEEPFYSQAAWDLGCNGKADSSLLQAHTYLLALVYGPLDGFIDCKQFAKPPSPLPGRIISVLLGVATVWVVYLLGKELYNSRSIGWTAALLLAVNFLHVRESHNGTPDVTAVLWITAALLAYALIYKKGGGLKEYVIASVITALAINGRLTSILLIVPFVVIHFYENNVFSNFTFRRFVQSIFSWKLILSGMIVLITFITLNAQIFVDPISYLKYWHSFLTLSSQIRYISDVLPAPLFYLRSVEWGAGLLLSIFMLIGLVFALYRRTPWDMILVLFIVLYFLVAAISKIYFARYIIPILPFLSLLAARFLWEFILPRGKIIGLAGIIGIILVQPLIYDIQSDTLLMQTDTRTLASAWINANIPPDAKVAAEWHTGPINCNNLNMVDFYGLSVQNFEDYKNEGYDYLITSSYIEEMLMKSAEEENAKCSFYVNLEKNAKLIYEVKPYRGDTPPPYVMDQSLGPVNYLDRFIRPGPTIRIYKISER